MYNRYIPQNDGSYRRSRMPEPPQPRREPPKEPPQPRQWEAPEPAQQPDFQPRSIPPRPHRTGDPVSIGTFLKQLLPRNFDTEDLLILLLLLLMSGDCRDDQNSALLTLVLYLFL